uniref:M20 aminoacylase family protein n=1 Tax=Pararhizobium sp. IMCC3301 TaxID=3067904 RepID=UPI0027428A83|nr:M20 aminoacylase family protein [Pararhizobium sp. IMCC3301]
MPIINRIADFHDEITGWRRDLHQHPELQYDLPRTARTVAELLTGFGCDEVVQGLGKTGVVAVIHGRHNKSGKVIGLRADMDALPIVEASGKPYASKTSGRMHACGHDGHTAMLLGAARYLAETRNFDGTAVLIFQPAEEGGAGAKAMIDDGLLDRFGIQEVFGMHNFPGLPLGDFAIRHGALMAATDEFSIVCEGYGAHAARPNLSVDPVLMGAAIVQNLQSIAARNVDPLESVVVSVTVFQAGKAFNVIPQTAELRGTIRSLTAEVRTLAEKRLRIIVENTAAAFGGTAKIKFHRGYPVTANNPEKADFAAGIAAQIVGQSRVNTNVAPIMGGEDFSYMLEQRPGAFIFVGIGPGAGLHHPEYDFNDEVIPVGVSYWARLVETAMAA